MQRAITFLLVAASLIRFSSVRVAWAACDVTVSGFAADDGTTLTTLAEPKEKFPIPMSPERPEEFAPGLDAELAAMADAWSEVKAKRTNGSKNVGNL